ncbi:IclR family transcriptional regulator [Gryllotalpicola reticulitermitis]|uniref:IclR family transcriptional regulator n=1 Tax=Gryllotalpicola reticulitermitis TaxID=1184153 RepID=A0ABV8Q7P1_9MICO
MVRPDSQDTASSLTRGLSLLDLFTVREPELSIRELARRSGLPKSTAHRLVGDLLAWGALERTPRGVRLGVHLFELGSLVPAHRRLREIAIPYAHNLNEVTQLTSNIAVRDGSDIMYVEKITSRSLNVPHSRVGGRLPMHCTALGKAMLAYSEPEFVDRLLGGELRALSSRTITSPQVIRAELAKIRETKVAYDVEESQPGLFCVAAPVFGPFDEVVGAISVTGATSLTQAQRFAPVVRTTAMALSRVLQSHSTLRADSVARSA